MEVLSSSSIETYILPSLSVGARGKTDTVPTLEIVQAILYRVKTGCQWRYLPVQQLFTNKPYTWQGIYHHYRQWISDGSWHAVFGALLKGHPRALDLSSVQLDASHTPAKRGAEAVGYQGRKRCKTSNLTVLSDKNGTPVALATPRSGQHHDTVEIEQVLREIFALLRQADIDIEGLFLNADRAFDSALVRSLCAEFGIEANIPINPRNGCGDHRDECFDEELYKHRTVIEHTFAWMDGCKALLVRYETNLKHWTAMNVIGFIIMLIRRILKLHKC
jgi:transposase